MDWCSLSLVPILCVILLPVHPRGYTSADQELSVLLMNFRLGTRRSKLATLGSAGPSCIIVI